MNTYGMLHIQHRKVFTLHTKVEEDEHIVCYIYSTASYLHTKLEDFEDKDMNHITHIGLELTGHVELCPFMPNEHNCRV